jgi:nucleoside-diphosphate-sugar epimerase
MSGRVAVTGATGFIGWHVCERLRDAGWSVAAIVRPESRKPLPDGVERVSAGLDTEALTDAFAHADTIVHVAGITRARWAGEYYRVNVEGTRAVAEAARARDARMVHVSSLTAAGPASVERPRTEADAPAPITAYGRSKRESEASVTAAAGLRWTILRPGAVYGPRDRQFLPLFGLARRGVFLRLPNAASFALNLVHVDDVARAIERVVSGGGGEHETLFIAYAEPVSMETILKTLASTFERVYRPVPVPVALLRAGGWLGINGLSDERVAELTSAGFACRVDAAERSLGFRAGIDLAEGFRSTASWYRANHWL